MIWKIVAGACVVVAMLVAVGGVTWGTAMTFASKAELAEAVVEISVDMTEIAGNVRSNRLLILNDRMAQAMAEARSYKRRGEPIPAGLLEWIRQLREQIEAEKR